MLPLALAAAAALLAALALRRVPGVALGADPSRVPPGTLVLFPLRRAVLRCGLAGIVEVARPEPFRPPVPADLRRAGEAVLAAGVSSLGPAGEGLEAYAGGPGAAEALLAAARELRRPGTLGLGKDLEAVERAAAEVGERVRRFCDAEEAALEEAAARLPSAAQEAVAARLLVLRDAAWCLEREFLGGLARSRDLAGPGASPRLLREMRKIDSTLDAIDRIEVRGRDSAGLLVLVSFPSGDRYEAFARAAAREGLGEDLRARAASRELLDGAVTVAETGDPAKPLAVGFVRKVAAEVGRLGDNVAALRERIRGDRLLHAALAAPEARVVVLGHTRWASNGIIHEANAHPVDNATVPVGGGAEQESLPPGDRPHPAYGRARGRVFVALNGDVDNHLDLHAAYAEETGRRGAPRVTTDTKVIALEVDRGLRAGLPLREAFRRAVASLEGSAAVAMVCDLEPGRVYLSLRGSGQALHVGLAPDGFIVGSEVYGLVHETSRHAVLEGERERVAGDRATCGTIAVLDAEAGAGPPELIGFDGEPLDAAATVRTAEITTRDVDRGAFPHYFRKEIEQAPLSVAKTLRGKFALEGPGGRRLRMNLGREILPEALEKRLREGRIRRIACVGQGTAAVAAAAVAAILREDLAGAPIAVEAARATELSGFGLREDMSDTLLVAVTQSGATADTNRAVDLARRRGAAVIAVVNRRNSDITRRADGVFHTSDGRDVEMSVASTKAFYSQVAAGAVLSLGLARVLGTLGEAESAARARDLRTLPDLLREVLALGPRIAEVAAAHAPTRRHWSVVGSGPNQIAAEEVRIKCSELCYKSIAADTVEDKKHIDLSSEALLLVLAAGNPPGVQGDLAKDVAIFQAHRGLPIVFADRGDARYDPYAAAVVGLPPASPRLAMLAHACAGHLFAYHAARAIDEGARFFGRIRAAVTAAMTGGGGGRGGPSALEEAARETAGRMRARRFDSALGPGAAAEVALLLQGAATGIPPAALGDGGAGAMTADGMWGATVASLTEVIRELERPVDAIRHQAKIVTVGTSRAAERPAGPLFAALEAARVHLDAVPESAAAALRALGPAVEAVEGWTRYRVEGLDEDGTPGEGARLLVEARGGVAASLPSRAEGGAPLKGTKRGVVGHRRLFVGVGAKDGRLLAIVPILDARLHATALALLHLRFRAAMPVAEKVAVLGVRGLEEIVNGVTEADVPWTDALLDPIPPERLFTLPVDRVVEAIVGRAKGA